MLYVRALCTPERAEEIDVRITQNPRSVDPLKDVKRRETAVKIESLTAAISHRLTQPSRRFNTLAESGVRSDGGRQTN